MVGQSIAIGLERMPLRELPILVVDGYSLRKEARAMPDNVLVTRSEEACSDFPILDHTSLLATRDDVERGLPEGVVLGI